MISEQSILAVSHITTTVNITDSLLSTNATLRARSPMLTKIPGARPPDRIIFTNGLGTQQIARLISLGGVEIGQLPLLPGEQVDLQNTARISAVIGNDTVLCKLFWYVKPSEFLITP